MDIKRIHNPNKSLVLIIFSTGKAIITIPKIIASKPTNLFFTFFYLPSNYR